MNREPIVRVNVKSQQFALKTLGLYSGAIDGNWTEACIKAQKELWRLHGGSCRDGQIMRSPAKLPRYFEWDRLDNQEFVSLNDPTGKVDAVAYAKAFVLECNPQPIEVRGEPVKDAGTLRAIAEAKSEELREKQAQDTEFKAAKRAELDVDLSRAKGSNAKTQAQNQAQAKTPVQESESNVGAGESVAKEPEKAAGAQNKAQDRNEKK